MKKLLATVLMSVIFCSSAEALLPPLYQNAQEIDAIVRSQELGKHLNAGDVILQITKNEKGYEIKTNKRRVQVDIIYKDSRTPGPAQFDVKFQTPQLLSAND